jgi:serine protease Do
MKNGKWFVLSVLLVSCILLFNSAGVSFAQDDNALQKLFPRLKPPVVLILCTIKGEVKLGSKTIHQEQAQSFGSGFIITPDGYLVTNGHVVEWYYVEKERNFKSTIIENVKKLYPRYFSSLKIYIKKDVNVILSNGEQYVAEVKQYSPPISSLTGKTSVTTATTEENVEAGKDVSILKIEGRNLPTVRLGDSGNVQGGDSIFVIGYPGVVLTHEYLSKKTILDSTVNQGHISGAKLNVEGTPIIQTDTAITHGNSGGPAFNSKGEVIGIATLGSIDQKGQEIQGFNFLVPVNTAKEFIRASCVDLNTESLFNKLWSEALDLYSKTDYEKALSKIDEVNRLMPNQPDVNKLQISAQEKISNPQKGGLPLVPIMIAVLGAIFVGGIVLVVILRGKGKKTPAPSSTSSTQSQQTKVALPPASLKCTEGPLAGRSFPITPSGLKIGRDPNKNQAVLDIEGVSREHACVVSENGKVFVKDLNSLNGTYLNSTDTDRIKSEPLKDGDVIIIGKGRFAAFSYKAS